MLVRRALVAVATLATSLVVFGASAPPALAATFTVDDVGDAGDATPGNGVCATATGVCTLRAAIDETNARPGRDTISFGFTGTGPFVIQLASALPSMFDPAGTVIDGYTQAGASPNTDPVVSNAVIQVEVRGGGPNGFDGFLISGPHNVIRGLSIREFRLSIRMFGTDSFDNQIVGNFLGIDATGTVGAAFYVRGAMSVNMQAGAHDNIVGAPGDGWAMAMTVVGHEREPSTLGYVARYAKTVQSLVSRVDEPTDELALAAVETEMLRLHVRRRLSEQLDGVSHTSEGSLDKLLMTWTEQTVGHASVSVAGTSDPELLSSYLYSRAQSVMGGTSQIQKNIIASRLLGLGV